MAFKSPSKSTRAKGPEKGNHPASDTPLLINFARWGRGSLSRVSESVSSWPVPGEYWLTRSDGTMRYGVHLTECRDWGRLAQRKGKEQQEGWARRFQRLGNGGSCHAGGRQVVPKARQISITRAVCQQRLSEHGESAMKKGKVYKDRAGTNYRLIDVASVEIAE